MTLFIYFTYICLVAFNIASWCVQQLQHDAMCEHKTNLSRNWITICSKSTSHPSSCMNNLFDKFSQRHVSRRLFHFFSVSVGEKPKYEKKGNWKPIYDGRHDMQHDLMKWKSRATDCDWKQKLSRLTYISLLLNSCGWLNGLVFKLKNKTTLKLNF